MSTAFDMNLFLAGVLTGSHTTRQRRRRLTNHQSLNAGNATIHGLGRENTLRGF